MKRNVFVPLILLLIVIIIGTGIYYLSSNISSVINQPLNFVRSQKGPSLLFVTYGSNSVGYLTVGQTSPPAGWIYWKINPETKIVELLDKHNMYFNEFKKEATEYANADNFNFSKALGLDERFGIGEHNKLRNIREKGSSNFLVQVYRDSKLELWKFNPDSSVLTQVTTIPGNVCIEQIIDWNSGQGHLLGFTTKQSLTDSSGSDISSICLYDYKNQTVLLDYSLPVTKQTYYSQAFGTIQSKKVVLDGSTIAILDLNTQDKNVLQGYEFFGHSRDVRTFIQNGVLPLQMKDSPGDKFLLSIYNLQDGKFSGPISFDRIPIDTYIYDSFLPYVLDSDHVLVRYSVIKEPRSTCWYIISDSSNKEKVLCIDDQEIYSQISPQINDISRTEFVKWYQ